MKISKELKIRPKFLALIFLVIGCMLLFGGLYTAGLWVPLFSASIVLLVTNSNNVIGMFPIKAYQLGFWVAVFLGVALHLFVSIEASFSLYILAFLLSISFRTVRDVLGIL